MDQRVVWRAVTHRHRRIYQVAMVVMLILFSYSLTFDDVSGFIRVTHLLLVAVPIANVVGARQQTAVDERGIEITGAFRTRRIPWTDITDVCAVRSEWEDPKVEIRLTDGSTRTLPLVGTDDVPQLEALRAPAPE